MPSDTATDDLSLEQQHHLDAACNAFEAAWTAGRRPPVEEFIPNDAGPGLRSALVRELVLIDAHYRARAGESPAPADYQCRFPEFETVWLSQSDTAPPGQSDAGAGVAPPGLEFLGELGRGGMGVVYQARDHSVGRVVAVKMIRSTGPRTPLEQARFQLEVELAARVHHPNVVTVYRAGVHRGQPFVVLEYVEGGTLRDRKPDGPAAATRLMVVVAEAVQALHNLGIVHRDLKPSNVLLAADGTPKITDFGLAKQVDGAGVASADLTATGYLVGTPAYMSPEQAAGEKAVGPETDVHSLGAILFELLTGRPPFTGSSALGVLEQIRTAEPPRPRGVNPAVPRDLEVICLKCLAKEPGRRYATAGALATDLRNHLDGRPIAARPAGRVERLGKWARRNPGVAVLTAALVLVIAGSIAGLTSLYLRARADRQSAIQEGQAADKARQTAERESQEAKRAQIVSQQYIDSNQMLAHFFRDHLIAAARTNGPDGKPVTVRAALDRAVAALDRHPPKDPAHHSNLRTEVGHAYATLDDRAAALVQYRKALAIRRQLHGDESTQVATLEILIAQVLYHQNRFDEAVALARTASERMRRLAGAEHGSTARLEMILAEILSARPQFLGEAEQVIRHALGFYRREFGPTDELTAAALRVLAGILDRQGRHDVSENHYREVLDIMKRLPPENRARIDLTWRLATQCRQQGKFAESCRLLEEVVRNADQSGRPVDTPELLTIRSELAIDYWCLDRLADAEPIFRDLWSRRKVASGERAVPTVIAGCNYVGVLIEQGKYDVAEPLAGALVEAARVGLGGRHLCHALGLNNLAWLDLAQGRADEAISKLRQSLAIHEQVVPKGDPSTARTQSLLGACLLETGRYAEAEPLLLAGYRGQVGQTGVVPRRVAETRERLVKLYTAWGKPEEAARWNATSP